MRQIRRLALPLIAGAIGLPLMSSFGTLQLPSVLAYAGIVCALLGLLAVLIPPRWLGFRARWQPLGAGLLSGILLFAGAWMLPAATHTTQHPATLIDARMPTYDFSERHEAVVDAPPERVYAALNDLNFDDIAFMQVLGQVRAIAMRQRASAAPAASAPVHMLDQLRSPRSNFFVLDDSPREFVFGLAGQPWNNRGVRLTPQNFATWSEPGNVKIAANFQLQDLGANRTRIITETRILATDREARSKMSKYWALIYPGSAMIRRGLLTAVERRAERP